MIPRALFVLGSGTIGRAIATLATKFSSSQINRIYVVDSSQENLDKIPRSDPRIIPLRTGSLVTLSPAAPVAINFRVDLPDVVLYNDIVINALPHYATAAAALACVVRGAHYFDLTEDVNEIALIHQFIKELTLQRELETLVAPQQGLAPGAIDIFAADIVEKDDPSEMTLMVGALTEFPHPPFDYAVTWSVDGLVNEYYHKSAAIVDGDLTQVEPLEGKESIYLFGKWYEAAYTSGGLGSLIETTPLRNLCYKTLRFPGHFDKMKFLIKDCKIPQKELRNIIDSVAPKMSNDEVLMAIKYTLPQRGDFTSHRQWSRKIKAQDGYSAIQLTTASGVLATVQLFMDGKIPQSGYLYHTDIKADDFVNTLHGAIYKEATA